MRNIYIIFSAITIVFLIFLEKIIKTNEGFTSLPHVRQGNYVLDLLGHLKTTTQTLANPQLWKERMAYIGKSPMDLAREYIKANKI